MIDNLAYSFIITGRYEDTKKEAWESFYSAAEIDFYWIKGQKFWRKTPDLFTEHHFSDEGPTLYVVKARCMSFDVLPKGFTEAKIRAPYQSDLRDFEVDVSLEGFAPAKIE